MSSYFRCLICDLIYIVGTRYTSLNVMISMPIFKLSKIMHFLHFFFFLFQIRTPSKRYLSKPPLWYKEPLFLVALAAVSIVIIIVVVAILCVKSKSYKYKGNYNIRSLNIYKDNLSLSGSTVLQKQWNFISFPTTNRVWAKSSMQICASIIYASMW